MSEENTNEIKGSKLSQADKVPETTSSTTTSTSITTTTTTTLPIKTIGAKDITAGPVIDEKEVLEKAGKPKKNWVGGHTMDTPPEQSGHSTEPPTEE